ncbi:hypothetical protein AgCh_008103 [Apium graveolens]
MILESIRRRVMTREDKYNGDYVPIPDHEDVSLSFLSIGDLEITKSSISKLRSAIYQLGEDIEEKKELKKKLVKVLQDKVEERQKRDDEPAKSIKIAKATWMADGTHWPGTWLTTSVEHTKDDHAGTMQVMLKPPSDEPLHGTIDEIGTLDSTDIDIRLPMLVAAALFEDGITDDTVAFKSAWKAACAVESAVVFAHSSYTFMITSTVFYGPCKPGIVFQHVTFLMESGRSDEARKLAERLCSGKFLDVMHL